MSDLKVAVISAGWPPRWGGGEIYPHRLVATLCKEGIDARGITLIPEKEGLNNGTAPVVRLPIPATAQMDLEEMLAAIWGGLMEGQRNPLLDEWLDAVCEYLTEEEIDVLIIQNQNLVVEGYPRLNELKDGRKIVILAYDIDDLLIQKLLHHSGKNVKGMKLVKSLTKTVQEWVKHYEVAPTYSLLSTHSIKGEDARLHLTAFSEALIDRAFGSGNSFVMHPPLEDSWWDNRPIPRSRNGPLRVGFINPFQISKGRPIICEMISRHPEYEFIGLKGGRQTSAQEAIAGLKDYLNRLGIGHAHLTMKDYLKNMEDFYDSIDVLLFPTLYEGYGMVASEALCRGIPVLTHDIPTVREATMDGAQYVPTSAYADMEEWSAMLQLIERNYEKYAEKALAAASDLKQRQESESRNLIGFLESLK